MPTELWKVQNLWHKYITAQTATGRQQNVKINWFDHEFGCRRDASGCVASPQLANVDELQGEWVVEDLAGRGLIDSSRITMFFGHEGDVFGRSGCNTYSAPYHRADNKVALGPVAATLRSCAPALMTQELVFFDRLSQVSGFRIDATEALVLTGADGDLVLARKE